MKNKIIKVTLSLFRSHKLPNITMDKIAKKNGISKRTLYNYFNTKEELIQECIRYRVNQENLLSPTNANLLDMLLNYQVCFQKFPIVTDRYLNKDIRCKYQDLHKCLFEYISAYSIACESRIDDGIAQGYIEEEISKNLISTFILNHFSILFSENRVDTHNNNEMMAETALAFIKGISTSKGRSYINEKLKIRK